MAEHLEPHVTESGSTVRELVRTTAVESVVLGSQLKEESAWLVTDKLVRGVAHVQVVILAGKTKPIEDFAYSVGGTQIHSSDQSIDAIVVEVCGAHQHWSLRDVTARK